mgnify:FL=1
MSKGGQKAAKIDPRALKMAENAEFKAYNLTQGTGSTTWDEETNSFTTDMNPTLTGIQNQGYAGVGDLLGKMGESYGRDAAQFGFDTGDTASRTQDIFKQQSALLQPEFAQQRSQLKNDLFGSGRMGLMIAGDASGAGAGGMVNPDAYGLGRAQSQTLANLAVGSREQALGEQQQQFDMEAGMFGANQEQLQQQSTNLLQGATGMLGFGEAMADREASLMTLGLQGEQSRGAASASGASGMAANMQKPEQKPNILGALISGAAVAMSDINLKENITKVGQYASGLNIYTWTWNSKGKELADPLQPTVGVMAQEAMLVFPEAVSKGTDGFLRVNYGAIK